MAFQEFYNTTRNHILNRNRLIYIDNINHNTLEDKKLFRLIQRKTLKCSLNELKIEILRNPLLQSLLCKDPVKQNIAEKCQYEYLKLNGILIERLPNTGSKSLHISPLGITNTPGNGKSIDAVIYLPNGEKRYTCMKYTTTNGGSQDNQCRDVINIVDEIVSNTTVLSAEKFILLLDGDYYEHNTRYVVQLKQKISMINNVKIYTSDELIAYKNEL